FDYAEPLRVLDAHADCDGVMAVYKNEGKWDASNVMTDGVWVQRYEKGNQGRGNQGRGNQGEPALDHIDYGATALRRSVVEALPPGERRGLDSLARDLAAQKRLRACVARERFFEIGSPEGLAELEQNLRTKTSPG